MALKTVAQLRTNFPTFVVVNRVRAPIDIVQLNGAVVRVDGGATVNLKSADLSGLPSTARFTYVTPTLQQLNEYDVNGDWGGASTGTTPPSAPAPDPVEINDAVVSSTTTWSSKRISDAFAAALANR